MIGRKTLAEVRRDLEAALCEGPAGEGEVVESLRRFLAAGPNRGGTPKLAPQRTRPTPARSGTEQGPLGQAGPLSLFVRTGRHAGWRVGRSCGRNSVSR